MRHQITILAMSHAADIFYYISCPLSNAGSNLLKDFAQHGPVSLTIQAAVSYHVCVKNGVGLLVSPSSRRLLR